MLNVPKNIVSASVSGIAALAMALNCQASTVVAREDSRMTAPMAFRYLEPAMISSALVTPPLPSAPAGPSERTDAGRRCQICSTSATQTICNAAVSSSMISVPNLPTASRVTSPPTIHPRMAPLPIRPNVRFASRVVRTKFASVQTWAGPSTDKTPTHT